MPFLNQVRTSIVLFTLSMIVACGGGGSNNNDTTNPPPTTDTTSPILSAFISTPNANSINFEFTSNEAGTAYYVLQLGGTAPSVAQIKNGSGNGGAVTASGNITVVVGSNNTTLTGLAEATTYTLYVFGEDAAGNQSTVANVDITTLDITAPVLSNLDVTSTGTTTTLAFTSDEDGSGYYAVQLVIDGQGTLTPTFEEVKTGSIQLLDGVNFATLVDTAAMNIIASTQQATLFNITDGNSYIVYVVAEDASNNESEVSKFEFMSSVIQVPPVVEADKIITSGINGGDIDLRILRPTDGNNDVLTASITALPSNGEISTSNGTVVAVIGEINLDDLLQLRFTADVNSANSSSTFSYEVSDGNGGTAQAMITTTIESPTDASSGFLIAGYTPQDGFGIYSLEQELSLVLGHADGERPDNDYYVVDMLTVGNNSYFSMSTPQTGLELWVYDGNTISLTKNIAEDVTNPVDSDPEQLIEYNNRVYFIASSEYEPVNGEVLREEVYWSDGTTTERVPSPEESVSRWDPEILFVMNGTLYAAGTDFAGFYKLENGAFVSAGPAIATVYYLRRMIIDNVYYFTDDDSYQIYSFDGSVTTKLTTVAGDINEFIYYNNGLLFYDSYDRLYFLNLLLPGSSPTLIGSTGFMGYYGKYFIEYKGQIYYSNTLDDNDFYTFDGSTASQVSNTPFSSGNIIALTKAQDSLLIVWRNPDDISEFWLFDGTNYTQLTSDIELNQYDYFSNFQVAGDRILMEARSTVREISYQERNYSQAVLTGTQVNLVSKPYLANESSETNIFASIGDVVYFTILEGTSTINMQHDKSTGITRRNTDFDNIYNSSQGYDSIIVGDSKFYYYSYDSANGGAQRGIWSYDGTTASFEYLSSSWNDLGKSFLSDSSLYSVKIIYATNDGNVINVFGKSIDFTYDFFPSTAQGSIVIGALGISDNLLYIRVDGGYWSYDFQNDPIQVNEAFSTSRKDIGYLFFSDGSIGYGNKINNSFFYTKEIGNTFELRQYISSSVDNLITIFDGTPQYPYQTVSDFNGNPAIVFNYLDNSLENHLILITDNNGVIATVELSGANIDKMTPIGSNNSSIILTDKLNRVWSHNGSSLVEIASFASDGISYTRDDVGSYIVGDSIFFGGARSTSEGLFLGKELWSWSMANGLVLIDDFNTTPTPNHLGGFPVAVTNLTEAGGLNLFGSDGNDVLVSSNINDTMTGGTGADVFIFNSNWANDVINDFEDGTDQIDLSNTGLSFLSLTIAQLDSNTTVSDSNGNSITLLAINPADLSTEDFIF